MNATLAGEHDVEVAGLRKHVYGKGGQGRWIPGPLNTKQILYLLFPQCLGAAILDGAANFGIAYAMYHKQRDIEVWPIQHNTIAGDMAVTTFIQGTLTFLIVSGLVHRDLRKRTIDPFPHPWRYTHDEDHDPITNNAPEGHDGSGHDRVNYFLHPAQFFCGSDANDIFNFSVPKMELFHRWLRTLGEGAVLSAVFFLLVWPISIAVVAPLFQQRNMAHTWISEIIKLLYGAILGLLMNPVCAMIALGSEDAVLRHHRTEEECREVMRVGNAAASALELPMGRELPASSVASFDETARPVVVW